MVRPSHRNVSCALLLIIIVGCYRCPKKSADIASPASIEVMFSIANEDKQAPISMMEISMDNNPIFRGAITASSSGRYTYVKTFASKETGIQLKVSSETDRDRIEAQKDIWLKDRLWVVVTRIREFEREPELQISISYEGPQ